MTMSEEDRDALQEAVQEANAARFKARGCRNPECYSGGCPECCDADEEDDYVDPID